YPEMEYFFGKVTMYTSFNIEARDLILYFMRKYFRDQENLVQPIIPLEIQIDEDKLKDILHGSTYEEDYKILSHQVRVLGENIPPLVNAYMSLSPSMKTFGTAINASFGGVEETAILIKIADVYETKKARHISTYIPRILKRKIF
ncbi:MAG: hemolysin, partial [Marinifilaceae bacterium]|nr:hemolysin [Marinifilaceae bacterium]